MGVIRETECASKIVGFAPPFLLGGYIYFGKAAKLPRTLARSHARTLARSHARTHFAEVDANIKRKMRFMFALSRDKLH